MQTISKAIVLKHTAYTSSTYILNIYSETLGATALMYRINKRNKRGIKEALSLIEFTYDSGSRREGMVRPSSIHIDHPLPGFSMSVIKQTIGMFLSELIYKTVGEEEANPHMFNFLRNVVIALNDSEKAHQFHIWFMIRFKKYLGIAPNFREQKFLDIEGGKGVDHIPVHPLYLNQELTQLYKHIKNTEDYESMRLSTTNSKALLKMLVDYYKIHIATFKELKSLQVLESISIGIKN